MRRARNKIQQRLPLASLLFIFWLLISTHKAEAQVGVYFDDSQPDTLIVSNKHYTLTLSSVNGGIQSLVDKATGVNLTRGSRYGCLWGAVFVVDGEEFHRGGCFFDRAGPNQFVYGWDAVQATLTLTYTWQPNDPKGGVDAMLKLYAAAGSYFDQQLTLTHRYNGQMRSVLLPSELLIDNQSTTAAYLPFWLPGLRLRPTFFMADRSFLQEYPGNFFADYLALDLAGSHLAFYTINPNPAPMQPVTLGFVDDDATNPNSFYTYHGYLTRTPPEKTVTTPRVRIQVGRPVSATLQAYRQDNGIDAFPSVQQKVGDRFTVLAQSPLIKADMLHLDETFQSLLSKLTSLPTPALLHLNSIQPRGHDENHPDFLPPAVSLGTLEDLQNLISTAQAHGLLVMPYSNPTWWDVESPTIRQMAPLTITDIAARDATGAPIFESYGANPEHRGFVVSPALPFVVNRLRRLMHQWTNDLHVDCIFEDQIGARPWLADFNPTASAPERYQDGWLEHTRRYADHCLMTEGGWDRLAETEVGFHGTVLSWARETAVPTDFWGAGNWEPYPLSGWLFQDKTLLYQHNLSAFAMSHDLATLTWNLAYGLMLTTDWQWVENDLTERDWFDLVVYLQRLIASQSAGQLLQEFTNLTPDVTRSRFGELTVIANWDPTLTYIIHERHIAPGGFYAYTAAPGAEVGVEAGVFTHVYNQQMLTPGEHYLIIERTPYTVTVRQPVGPSTLLAIDAPADWQPGATVQLLVYDQAGALLGKVDHWIIDRRIYFYYQREWKGVSVGRYEVVNTQQAFLPLNAG